MNPIKYVQRNKIHLQLCFSTTKVTNGDVLFLAEVPTKQQKLSKPQHRAENSVISERPEMEAGRVGQRVDVRVETFLGKKQMDGGNPPFLPTPQLTLSGIGSVSFLFSRRAFLWPVSPDVSEN